MKIPYRIRESLLYWAVRVMNSRPHDFAIGDPNNPQLLRWWIIPKNSFLCIYVHLWLRSDDARALHDHRGINCSILLSGIYLEILKDKKVHRTAGEVIFRFPRTQHRVELLESTVATLFITGPDWHHWGFYCPQGFRKWEDFVAPHNKGEVGRGCD